MQSIRRPRPLRALSVRSLLLPLLAGFSPAQDFQTPGMPRSSYGQTDRFSNDQNPAIGLVAATFYLTR